MADTSPLLASLLLGQKRRVDPIEAQRTFGQKLIAQGGSTAPLGSGSPLEGLARALQGGLGGLVAGYADQQEQDKGKKQIAALGQIAGAKNQDELTAAIKGSEIDPDLAGPLMAQLLQGKQDQFARTAAGGTFAGGFAPAQGAPGPGNGGTSITINRPNTSEAPAGPSAIGPVFADAQKNFPGLTVSSGTRTPEQNTAVGGAQDSQHLHGAAYDIPWPANATPEQKQAIVQQFNNDPRVGGIGVYDTHIHVDTGPPGRRWGGAPPAPQASPQVAQAGAPIAPSGTPNPQAQGGPDPQQAQAPMPSAISQPPEVPRPQPTPEQVQRYRSMVEAKGGMTIEQANQGLNKEITDQWQADKARALAIWQDQQQSKRIQETGAQRLGQEAPMTMIKDRVSNYETKVRPGAIAAINDIQSINQTRQILDAGAFTGTGAEAKTLAAKVGEQLGIPSDQAQNTQVLGATLAKRVLAGAGGTLGTGFSNADRDFMEKAQGGQLSMDEGALRRILDIGEKQARQTLKNHDTEAARVMQLPGMGQLGAQQFQVPQAPTYDEFNKANPLAPLQTSPQGQAAPQTQLPKVSSPDEALKLGSGKKFILPDGRVGTVP